MDKIKEEFYIRCIRNLSQIKREKREEKYLYYI